MFNYLYDDEAPLSDLINISVEQSVQTMLAYYHFTKLPFYTPSRHHHLFICMNRFFSSIVFYLYFYLITINTVRGKKQD